MSRRRNHDPALRRSGFPSFFLACHADGWPDAWIARTWGASVRGVAQWRDKLELPPHRARRRTRSGGPITLRRWKAAHTNRLNEAHWGRVTGRTINLDLGESLRELRIRCEYEVDSNPDLDGVVNTHAVDVLGDAGPKLQVVSDSEDYNDWLEALWREWWESPDAAGIQSGADLLHMWWRSLWTAGEYLVQFVSDPDVGSDAVALRLHTLPSSQLGEFDGWGGEPDVMLGVRRNAYNKPLEYRINTASPESGRQNWEWIEARRLLHRFRVLEAGQARGVPWAAIALEDAAELRDYDEQVLDAARQAADSGVYLYTNSPEAKFRTVTSSADIERRTITTCPPGYQPMQITPQQPSTQYVDFRDEKLRCYGRPVGMPLMMIKLDSRNHNYSSARFDGQVYLRHVKRNRHWAQTGTMNVFVREVEREGLQLRGAPRRPRIVRLHWNWPALPHVDPLKEVQAAALRVENCFSCVRDECADLGRDWEDVRDQLSKERQTMLALLPGTGKPATVASFTAKDDEDEDDNDDDKGKSRRGRSGRARVRS